MNCENACVDIICLFALAFIQLITVKALSLFNGFLECSVDLSNQCNAVISVDIEGLDLVHFWFSVKIHFLVFCNIAVMGFCSVGNPYA